MLFRNSATKIVITIFLYIFVTIVIICGAYAFYRYYEKSHQTSETYGSLSYVDPYQDFELYNINLDDMEFNSDGETRTFETSFPVSLEFDGENNKYNLLINNSPCNTEQSTYGFITCVYELYFQDLDGSIISTIELNITVKVYVAKVDVKVETIANNQDYAYLLEYIDINGFKIRLIEEQYSKKILTHYVPIALTDLSVSQVPEYTPTAENPTPSAPIPANIDVRYNTIKLQEGVDYTTNCYISRGKGSDCMSYQGYITITGKGQFTGSVTHEYTIPGLSKKRQLGDNLEVVSVLKSLEDRSSTTEIFNGITDYSTRDAQYFGYYKTFDGYGKVQLFNKNINEFQKYDVCYIYPTDNNQDVYFSIGFQDYKHGNLEEINAVVKMDETYTFVYNNSIKLFELRFYNVLGAYVGVDLKTYSFFSIASGDRHFSPANISYININNIIVNGDFIAEVTQHFESMYLSAGNNIDTNGYSHARENIEFELNENQSYYEAFVWDLVGLPAVSGTNTVTISNGDITKNLDWEIGKAVTFILDGVVVNFDFYLENQKIALQVNTNDFSVLDNMTLTINNFTYEAENQDEMVIMFLVDDEIYSSQIVKESNSVGMPIEPTKDGYTFLGWSKDGENLFDFSRYVVTGNTKFVAVFEEIEE